MKIQQPIRYHYINNTILNIYTKLPSITFPFNPLKVIDLIPNCKYLSYQDFAEINQCTIAEVELMCNSKSGCSHYDASNNRYLILCNQSTDNNNTPSRQRWTCSHEIGHIVCNHHLLVPDSPFGRNLLCVPNLESEADYFAATLLSPFPLFKPLNIKCESDIRYIFGVSHEASKYRYKQYLNWVNTRVKTSWENDIVKLYIMKSKL